MKKITSGNRQRGNVFLFILIGVVLFAALSYSIARGFRGENTNRMAQRQAVLSSSEMIDFGQRLQRAVGRVRNKGCSENQINFANPVDTSYVNSDAPADGSCDIFGENGGNLKWQEGWFITARNFVEGVPSAGNYEADLVAFYLDIPLETCNQINATLGISNSTPTADDTWQDQEFTGSFDASPNDIGGDWTALAGHPAGCIFFGQYDYYHTILAR